MFLIAGTIGFTVFHRCAPMHSKRIREFFVISVVAGFVLTTILNIRLFIRLAITGNIDAPVALGLAQTMINPLHFVIPKRLIYRLLEPLPGDTVSCGSAIDMIPFDLWNAIIIDLLMGSLFWAAVALVVIRLLFGEKVQREDRL
ncbi:MAG: hypothetical protein DRJ61_05565 [Acidobacteria bacterium]|nr:MAG: hypothetical protein DRJ61_05565 [Acidobacteriota bacterium]